MPVDAVYVCPHERDACDCRKPGTGSSAEAMRDDPAIDPASSVVIGDADSDMQAGEAFGAAPSGWARRRCRRCSTRQRG